MADNFPDRGVHDLRRRSFTGFNYKADTFTWLVVLTSIVSLVLVLTGTSLGADLFLVCGVLLALPWLAGRLNLMFRSPGLWLIPSFALLSVIWSQDPSATLRAALELCLTIGSAFLTAGLLRPREFVATMLIGLLFAAVLSLLFGKYGVDGMSGQTVFLGVFASKNTLAMIMTLLVLFASAALLDTQQPAFIRIAGAIGLPLSIPLLLHAHSVGAFLTAGFSVVMLLLIVVISRLTLRERMLLLTVGAILAVPVAILAVNMAYNGTLANLESSFLAEVGKDPTLTGRTVLWQIALNQISKSPFFGIGYEAFWVQGNLLPEGIWREFQIDSRSGFNFQNTFLEAAVGLGWVGAIVLAMTMVQATWRVGRLAFAGLDLANAGLLAALLCLISRTIAEVDVPGPFSIGTYLLFVIAAYGADYVGAVRHQWKLQPAKQTQQVIRGRSATHVLS